MLGNASPKGRVEQRCMPKMPTCDKEMAGSSLKPDHGICLQMVPIATEIE